MLLFLKDVVEDTRFIIKRETYNYHEGSVTHYFDDYPYELYSECKDYNKPNFNLIHFRRFCDRNLSGDVILSYVDRSYGYNYYVNPEETWRYSHYSESWTFIQLNFELLCDWFKVKNTFQYWCNLPDKNTRKTHHDWMHNEHIDCSDTDKWWDPRWKMYTKLSD